MPTAIATPQPIIDKTVASLRSMVVVLLLGAQIFFEGSFTSSEIPARGTAKTKATSIIRIIPPISQSHLFDKGERKSLKVLV